MVQGIQAGSRAGMSVHLTLQEGLPSPCLCLPAQTKPPLQGLYHHTCSENSGAGSLGRAGQGSPAIYMIN